VVDTGVLFILYMRVIVCNKSISFQPNSNWGLRPNFQQCHCHGAALKMSLHICVCTSTMNGGKVAASQGVRTSVVQESGRP